MESSNEAPSLTKEAEGSELPLSQVFRGLSEGDAQARLLAEGPNELPSHDRRSLLRIVFNVVREPMLALLIIGGLLYLALGSFSEAVVLVVFALLSIVITIVQETRTERVLETLRDMTSPRALVLREGIRRRIAGKDVVRGDLVIVSEGDRVPADARLVECDNLQVDESLLTGESVPVRKRIAADPALPIVRPGGDDLPFVFSGTLIVRGAGMAEVVATGAQSEIGRIGHALRTVATEQPRLQKEINRLVRTFGIFAGAVIVLVMLLYGLLRGGWLKALLTGIALGMAMLPEEFPVVLTVFMAMGAWRISQARVLTRRPAAIESLGAATVLCTDKTGTLTENRMSIAELRLEGGETFSPVSGISLPEAFRTLAEYGILASPLDPFDPMEKALHDLGREHLGRENGKPGADWSLLQSFGMRPDLLAMTQVWQAPNGQPELVMAAKGAPEAILSLCRLGDSDRNTLLLAANALAVKGLRVLGVARANTVARRIPDSQQEISFSFLGFVGFADALRSSVPAAVAECRSAGIRVIMITGDYPATARAIGAQAGISGGDILTGDLLAAMTDAELARHARTTSIFARIMPEQKLRIVNALKANGEVVAMTGDGVNDAPSLKAAHIGIAMGGRGTDVAREAAAIVLLDDDFGSIVKSIRLGRRIFDNLRKAMAFILAVHVPIAALALMPLLFGLPIFLEPVHIAFLEMIIDPVCTLVFEAEGEEDDIMRRAPRAPDKPLFSPALIGWGLFQGAIAFALVAGIFIFGLDAGMPEPEVRALTFFSLVMTVIGLVLVNRSFSASALTALRRPNRALLAVLIIVAALLALTLAWPYARNLFHFGPLHADDLALTIAAGLVVLIGLEAAKPLWRKALFGAAPRPSAKTCD